MRSDRKAKKILKAFGKEAYKERIKYVDSFLPEKISFIGSISYRHALRKVGIVVLLTVLILALATSTYAAIIHYLNYTKIEHPTNDEYIANGANEDEEAVFYEPTYVPEGYVLESVEYDELFGDKEWTYRKSDSEILVIRQRIKGTRMSIDNEHTIVSPLIVEDIEAVLYKSSHGVLCMFQYYGTVVTISGPISKEEIEKLIKGMVP